MENVLDAMPAAAHLARIHRQRPGQRPAKCPSGPVHRDLRRSPVHYHGHPDAQRREQLRDPGVGERLGALRHPVPGSQSESVGHRRDAVHEAGMRDDSAAIATAT